MKKILSILLLLSTIEIISAQTGMLGYGSNASIPNQTANPALTGDARLVISIPVLSNIQVEQKASFKLSDWLASDNGKTYLSFDKFAPLAQPRNDMNTNLALDLFSVGFRVKKNNYFSLGLQHFSTGYLSISDDLIKLAAEGNANNPIIVLNEESAYVSQFNTIYLGYARSLMNDKLKIGAKLKRIQGISHFQTDNVNFNITTSSTSIPAYAISVSGSMEAMAGGVLGIATDTLLNNDVGDVFGKNITNMGSGMGFDLGVSYQVTDKISVSASTVNLGNITWNKDFAGKVAIVGTGKFEFTGVKTNLNDSGNNSNAADSLERSAKDAFKIQQSKTAFTSSLPTLFYVSAGYKLSEKHQLTGVYRMQKFNTKSSSIMGINYTFTPLSMIQLLAGVNTVNFKSISFGAGLVFSPGPIQLHILADNLTGLAAVDNTNLMQIQVGLNVVLKKKKEATPTVGLELSK